jgi:hypothetical protein
MLSNVGLSYINLINRVTYICNVFHMNNVYIIIYGLKKYKYDDQNEIKGTLVNLHFVRLTGPFNLNLISL